MKLNTGTASQEVSFADVDVGHWALPFISAVNKAGIMQGYGNGTFLPDAPITREELVKVIMVIVYGKDLPKASLTILDRFRDRGDISGWAENYIALAAEQGTVKGIEADLFGPTAKATRSQVVALIYRILDAIEKSSNN
jgi:hypothetical protein